jgi:photosystem II stability/assembly factor-like uncharacterized protein
MVSTGMLYQSFDNGVRWQSVAVREGLELRSVSSAGHEIWAGGKGGALFHSTDDGHHWRQVMPSSHGFPLVDDIERVDFTAPFQVSVTTTSRQTWVTMDQGQTWARQ